MVESANMSLQRSSDRKGSGKFGSGRFALPEKMQTPSMKHLTMATGAVRKGWLEKKPSSGKSMKLFGVGKEPKWQKRWIVLEQVRDAATLTWSEKEGGLCLLYTSPSPRDRTRSRMPSSA